MMKQHLSLLILLSLCTWSFAHGQQKDTLKNGIVVFRDYRLPIVKQRESEINTILLKERARHMRGYRIMILNTSNKDYAFKVRADLLQRFPEQKPYMWFSNPYIRLKFGDFTTREEAEEYQKKISDMLGGTKVYLLNETIEVNPGNDFDPESMRDVILK